MRRGFTNKPCHGCGGIEERPKDKLCYDCQKIYNNGILASKMQSEQHDKIIVLHSNVSHWISRPYVFESSGYFFCSQLNDLLHKTWSDLTMSIVEPSLNQGQSDTPRLITDKPNIWGAKGDWHDHYYLVDATIRDAVNKYDFTLRIALEYSYLAGKKQGISILQQLNEGGVSTSTYEDNVNKVEKRIDELKQKLG